MKTTENYRVTSCKMCQIWLQEFRHGLVDESVPEHPDASSSSHELPSEPRGKVVWQAQFLHSFPEGQKMRHLHEDQNNKESLQKTHWHNRTSCWKNWWLDNSRSQSSQWRLWIPIQSSICCRGTGFGYSMDSSVSVQNKNFTGNSKKLAKVLGARKEACSHLHWQFPRIWQSLWRSILKSLYVNTSPFRNIWDCWESSTQNERRYVCCTVAIRSGWKMVGRFHGMLLLSAKHTRSLVWLEDTSRKAIRRTIQRTHNSVWLDCRISPVSARDLSRLHQSGKNVLPGIFFGYVSYAEWIWKGDIVVADIEELEQRDSSEIHAWRLDAKEVSTPMSGEKFIFTIADGTVKIFGARSGSENIHFYPGPPRSRRRTRKSSRRIRRVFTTLSRLIAGWW